MVLAEVHSTLSIQRSNDDKDINAIDDDGGNLRVVKRTTFRVDHSTRDHDHRCEHHTYHVRAQGYDAKKRNPDIPNVENRDIGGICNAINALSLAESRV